MNRQFTMDELQEILQSSIGMDEGVRLDAEQAETAFAELGYDSLAMLELASQIKHRIGVHITDEAALEEMATPRAAVEFVNRQLATEGG
jgi:minimal PKS acyl carrier protein